MKKIILGAVIVVVVTGFLLYKFYLPTYLAKVLTEDEVPSYLPENYKITIDRLHKPMAKYSQEILSVSDSAGISLETLLKAIDNVDTDEVMAVYEMVNEEGIKSSEQVFNLIQKNITIKEFDVRIFKKIFMKYATVARMQHTKDYVEEHDLVTSLAPETAKKLARQMIIKHYDRFKKEQQAIGK